MTKYLKLILTVFMFSGLGISVQASEIQDQVEEDSGSGKASKPATSGTSGEDTSGVKKKSATVNVGVATAVSIWLTKFIRWETTQDANAPKNTSRLAFLKSKKFLAATGVAAFAVGVYWYDPETAISYGKYILTPIFGSYFGGEVPGGNRDPFNPDGPLWHG